MLLAAFRDWVGRAAAVFPIEGGFALRWKAAPVYAFLSRHSRTVAASTAVL